MIYKNNGERMNGLRKQRGKNEWFQKQRGKNEKNNWGKDDRMQHLGHVTLKLRLLFDFKKNDHVAFESPAITKRALLPFACESRQSTDLDRLLKNSRGARWYQNER